MDTKLSDYPSASLSGTRSIWKSCLVLVCVALFFGFGGMLFGSIAASAASGKSASKMQEHLIDGEPEAEKKIVIIPIKGLIMESMGAGPGTVSQVASMLKAIKKDENVVGVLLEIDTPGGGVTASDRIYHDLVKFKEETKLPMESVFLDVAASGGYYVAMASDKITAHPTTITGSIGVISKFYNFTDVMEKVGVSVNVVKSLNSEGKVSFKDIGSPYRPMRPEERKLLQGLVTEMWERFTEVVVEGRKGKLEAPQIRKLADGRVFTGAQALELKLIDAIGYKEDVYASIREASKHPNAKIVTYKKEPGLKELLGFSLAQGLEPLSVGSATAKKILGDYSGFCYVWTAGSL